MRRPEDQHDSHQPQKPKQSQASSVRLKKGEGQTGDHDKRIHSVPDIQPEGDPITESLQQNFEGEQKKHHEIRVPKECSDGLVLFPI